MQLALAFAEQVSTDVYLKSVFYVVCTAAIVVGVIALTLIDLGLARSNSATDTVTQKIVATIAGAAGFAVVGYAIWNWQHNIAFGVENPLGEAIKTWWIAGDGFRSPVQSIDPQLMADADVNQVFAIFFVAFGGFVGAAIHTIGLERMRPGAVYLTAFVAGAVILPVVAFLVWGSTSPLTNRGVHDFSGGMTIYLPLGVMSVLLSWKLRPRRGAFSTDPREVPKPTNLAMVGLGVLLALAVVPFFALGSGFVVPGEGYFGISMTTSSFGIVLANVFAAYIGAGISGALLSYRLRDPYWAIAGPFTGYIAAASVADVIEPWQMLLVSLGAPLVAYGTYRLLKRLRIDDGKFGPLALGPVIWGILVGGFTEWGERTGGYFGITEGDYAFQHARITPLGQLVGLVVVVLVVAAVTLTVATLLDRRGRLRLTDEERERGMDELFWDAEPAEPAAPIAAADGVAPPAAPVAGGL